VGVQSEARDERFRPLGRQSSDLRRSVAGNVSVELGGFGAAALTAASIDFFDAADARTFTLSYSPRLGDGALSARVIYTEREDSDLAFGLTFTAALSGDVSASAGYDQNRRGASYRASLQRAAAYDGAVGWRARASVGRRRYAEFAARRRGRYGESVAQVARAGNVLGARLGHGGSIGVVEGRGFVAPPIRGGFALVDVGAAGVRVERDRFVAGVTNTAGRVVLTDLRPYDANVIAIRADDLPFDQTPAATQARISPAHGAGVLVHFTEDTGQLIETHALVGAHPATRGSVLVRRRDGARFPVGSQGRVVLRGARAGDIVELDLDRRCSARADIEAAADGLALQCGDA
jgi:outer membrane usher protein